MIIWTIISQLLYGVLGYYQMYVKIIVKITRLLAVRYEMVPHHDNYEKVVGSGCRSEIAPQPCLLTRTLFSFPEDLLATQLSVDPDCVRSPTNESVVIEQVCIYGVVSFFFGGYLCSVGGYTKVANTPDESQQLVFARGFGWRVLFCG
jgi:hypothetical protein